MPTRTMSVDPELFVSHKGVEVYHTYKNDDMDQGCNQFHYTANPYDDEHQFDIRELAVPALARLNDHPPFMSAPSNPAFATATDEEKASLQAEWDAWRAAGGYSGAIRAIVCEAIDLGLITQDEDADTTGAVDANTGAATLQYTVNEIHTADYAVQLTPEQLAEYQAFTSDEERVQFAGRMHEQAVCMEGTMEYNRIQDDSMRSFYLRGIETAS